MSASNKIYSVNKYKSVVEKSSELLGKPDDDDGFISRNLDFRHEIKRKGYLSFWV